MVASAQNNGFAAPAIPNADAEILTAKIKENTYVII